MPDTRTFTDGAGDGNLTTATNWSDNTVPIGGDSVIFNAYNREITTGLGSVALASCIVAAGNASKFTAPITTGTITSLDFSGSGPYALFTGTVTQGVINIAHDRRIQVNSGTWGATEIRIADGTIEFAAAVVLTNIYNGRGRITAYSNATEIPLLVNEAGHIICDGRSVEDYWGGPGSVLTCRNAAGIADGSSGAQAYISAGGRLNLEGTTLTSDKIVYGGIVDCSRSKGVQTIANRYPLPGGKFVDSASFPAVISTDHAFGTSSSAAGGAIPYP